MSHKFGTARNSAADAAAGSLTVPPRPSRRGTASRYQGNRIGFGGVAARVHGVSTVVLVPGTSVTGHHRVASVGREVGRKPPARVQLAEYVDTATLSEHLPDAVNRALLTNRTFEGFGFVPEVCKARPPRWRKKSGSPMGATVARPSSAPRRMMTIRRGSRVAALADAAAWRRRTGWPIRPEAGGASRTNSSSLRLRRHQEEERGPLPRFGAGDGLAGFPPRRRRRKRS